MGKINRYCNVYDKNNVIINHVNTEGLLEDMTLKQVQDLVDKLGTDKDENGKIKDKQAFDNASNYLMRLYTNPKYSKEVNEFINNLRDRLKVNTEAVNNALIETNNELKSTDSKETVQKTYDVNTNDEEYVEYKEINNEEEGH